MSLGSLFNRLSLFSDYPSFSLPQSWCISTSRARTRWWTSEATPAVAGRITSEGSVHLQRPLLSGEEKNKKAACSSHCVSSELHNVQTHRRSLDSTLCLDERWVLMRPVWEFNEARWEPARSDGRLLMWAVLRGFLSFLGVFFNVWDSFESPNMYCKQPFYPFMFQKNCTLVEVACDLDLNRPVEIVWPERAPRVEQ